MEVAPFLSGLGMRLASVQPHNQGALGDKPEEVGS